MQHNNAVTQSMALHGYTKNIETVLNLKNDRIKKNNNLIGSFNKWKRLEYKRMDWKKIPQQQECIVRNNFRNDFV